MRLVSWNILQGGGRRLPDICAALSNWKPDIVTLQEVRKSTLSDLAAHLREIGLRESYFPNVQSAAENAPFIASCGTFDAGDFIDQRTGLCHVLEADLGGLALLPVHFPQKAAQVPLFNALLDDSDSLLRLDALLVGDLNCGIPFEDSSEKTFQNADYFRALLQAGWVDLYRKFHGPDARDFSWISPRTERGFRYDHALASPTFAKKVTAFRYDHSVREARFSDHSALIIDFED